MPRALLGKKLGMTQVFDEAGAVVPVTLIQSGPCEIMQVKTKEHEGYAALQLGFEDIREKSANAPQRGHAKKAGVRPKRLIREVHAVEGDESLTVGMRVTNEIFEGVQFVDVSGVSKGKGFAGTMKRHGFHGGPKTHGQSNRHRAPGSIGQCSYPSRVFKGVKMAGHMGGERVTVKNLKLVRLDKERNLMMVKGPLPGSTGAFVIVRISAKNR